VKLPRSACIAAAVAGVVAHLLYLGSLQGRYCIDDAYISFRFAENLAGGHGLTFNPGERVEGYTSFGWVVVTAVAAKLGMNLELVSRLVSALATALLAGLAVAFLLRRAARPAASWILAGFVVADGTLARWGQDGMETALFALLVLLGASLAVRDTESTIWPLAFVAAALTRPEGLLFFGVTWLWSVAVGERASRWMRALRSAGMFTGVYAPYFLWRWHYYGFLLPNTSAGGRASEAQLARGGRYLAEFFFLERWPLLLLAFVALGLRRRLTSWQILFLSLVAANALYALLVGGDWMGPGRFLLPTLVLLYALVADVTASAFARRAVVAGVGAAVAIALFVLVSLRKEQISLRAERPFLESRGSLGSWLAEHAAPGDSLLTNEIGQLAYFSKLATHDLHGLTDPHIAHLRIGTIGEGKPGHEKSTSRSFNKRPT
jgi:hypothetical protein